MILREMRIGGPCLYRRMTTPYPRMPIIWKLVEAIHHVPSSLLPPPLKRDYFSQPEAPPEYFLVILYLHFFNQRPASPSSSINIFTRFLDLYGKTEGRLQCF